MINLPSANYQAQDARIEVYNDKVIVRARENGTELGGEYNYTWFAKDGSLVKNAPETTTEIYKFNGEEIAGGETHNFPAKSRRTIMTGMAT